MTSQQIIKSDESGLSLLIPIISVIGMIGNATVLIVYLKKMGGTGGGRGGTGGPLTNIFIATLAMNDLIACVVVMPLTLIYELAPSLVFTTSAACKLYYLFTASVIPFSAFLMTAISIDRYLCICQPLKQILTPLRARIVVVVLAVCATTMGTLVAIQYTVATVSTSDYVDPTSTVPNLFGNETTLAQVSQYYTDNLASSSANSNNLDGFYTSSRLYNDSSALITSTINSNDMTRGDDSNDWVAGGCNAEPVLGVAFENSYHYIHNTITFVVALALTFIFYALIYSRIWSRHLQKASRKAATSRALQQRSSNPQIIVTQASNETFSHTKSPRPTSTSSLECSNITNNNNNNKECSGGEDEASATENGNQKSNNDSSNNNNGFHIHNKGGSPRDIELKDKTALLSEEAPMLENTAASAADNNNNNDNNTSINNGRRATTTSIGTNSSTKQSFKISGELGTQIRLAAMLFVVTVVFTLSYVPAFLANYTGLFGDPENDPWNRFVFYIYFVNNAANPIIYGVMNRNFREDLRQLCCGHLRRSNPNQRSVRSRNH